MGKLSFAAFAFALLFTGAAHAEDTVTTPFPGVKHLHRTTTNPNQNINVLTVDLCSTGIAFRATKPSEKARKTSDFGALVQAQAAVNGDFFKGDFSLERGIGVGDGVPWPIGTPEDVSVGQLAFGANRVELIRDSVVQRVEPWMKNVVGGRPTLLYRQVVQNFSGHPDLCKRFPRTAVGLTSDKRTLFIAVVDGRNTARVGMTCDELAGFMKGLGAYDALAFDGGGSSTMWLEGQGVINYPTDGNGERTVASHLALYAKGEGAPGSCNRPLAGSTPEQEEEDDDTPASTTKRGTTKVPRSAESEASESDAEAAAGCNVAHGDGVAQGGLFALAALGVMFARRRRSN